MSRGLAAAAAVALGIVSVGTLVWAATGDDEGIGAVRPTEVHLKMRYPLAAAGAYGRRVLVLHDHGAGVTGEVFESARFGGSWELFPPAPPGATLLADRLAELAARAAGDLQASRSFSGETTTELARHAVAIVLIENGKIVVEPPASMRTGGRFSVDATGRGLRVQGAELAWRLTDDGEELAPVLDPSDGLWGGAVTIDAPTAATYRFAWGIHGARIKVDGERIEPDVVPLPGAVSTPSGVAPRDTDFLHLYLPAGRSRVDVSYVDDGTRGFAAIGGGVGLVASLLILLLLFRPRLSHDQVE